MNCIEAGTFCPASASKRTSHSVNMAKLAGGRKIDTEIKLTVILHICYFTEIASIVW
jgi:hypothetical protein